MGHAKLHNCRLYKWTCLDYPVPPVINILQQVMDSFLFDTKETCFTTMPIPSS